MRMTTALNRLLPAAALLLAVAGCTDLNLGPESNISAANIFNDPASYRAYLAKLYVGLTVSGQEGPAGNPDIQGIDEGFSSYLRLYWQMEELPTDEAIIAWNDGSLRDLNTQNWATTNEFFAAMYSRIYFQISLANEFLRQTTDDKLASRGVTGQLLADVHQYRAEARFLRALSYWHGLDLFGNIPLVTEANPVGATPPAQATRAEIFDFVDSELNAIRADLPPSGPGGQYYGRATQAAADMLLAKLYLNASAYVGQDRSAAALTALKRVVAAGYSLDPSYAHLFLADNNTSPEIIFAVPQDGLHTRTFGGMTYLVHAPVGGNMNATDFGIDGGWWGLRVRPELVALYPSAPTGPDLRDTLFFTTGQSLDVASITTFTDGWALGKYKNVTSDGTPGSDPGFPDTDYPMFRLADAYLMYAEAVLRSNGSAPDSAQALTYVNAIRTRAYGNTSGNITMAQLTLPFILDERARELVWEAQRRVDLVRFGKFTESGVWQWKGGTHDGTTTDAHLNLYPIPATELVANPNLTQNPGY